MPLSYLLLFIHKGYFKGADVKLVDETKILSFMQKYFLVILLKPFKQKNVFDLATQMSTPLIKLFLI